MTTSKLAIAKYPGKTYNAGPKAKTDIEKILASRFGFECLSFSEPVTYHNSLEYKIRSAHEWASLRLRSADTAFFQLPFPEPAIRALRAKKRIGIVHDLNGLRYGNPLVEKREIAAIKALDLVIVHNQAMRTYVAEQGIDDARIVTLEIFDYLCTSFPAKEGWNGAGRPTLVYPGNLSAEKSPFLHELSEGELQTPIRLYGNGYSSDLDGKFIYGGVFEPDQIGSIEGDLGLVWDGFKDERDASTGFKGYTRYNCPHKLSCLLACGMPVIVWSKAAMADFVTRENVGYTINKITDIDDLTFDDYVTKLANARRIGDLLRAGTYTTAAVTECLSRIS